MKSEEKEINLLQDQKQPRSFNMIIRTLKRLYLSCVLLLFFYISNPIAIRDKILLYTLATLDSSSRRKKV